MSWMIVFSEPTNTLDAAGVRTEERSAISKNPGTLQTPKLLYIEE